MEDALLYHRLQFAFTISFHYLFPQLTMGLALLIVYFKGRYLKTNQSEFNEAAHFWMKVFALNFGMGVITGIPMEFQFGTNWARFSNLTGGVIGQTLALEGLYSFFLESSFLAMFIYGEKMLGQRLHFISALLILIGSWLSGWFILATNSWMQHPVGHEVLSNGKFVLKELSALFSNPWLLPSYLHNQVASLITACFVMAGVGAFYLLNKKNQAQAQLYLKTAIVAGLLACLLVAFPTGDLSAKNVARHQPATFAAMEGLFETSEGGAEIVLVGQPDMENLKLDNKIAVPNILSFLTWQNWDQSIKGLKEFDRGTWPTNIPALYYSYHIMVGLGTIFIAIMAFAALQLYRKKLIYSKRLLWVFLLAWPFPYIANTAGWYTAELGRQPWLVYGLLRTHEGSSIQVTAGNSLFTLLGFIALYLLLGFLYVILFGKLVVSKNR